MTANDVLRLRSDRVQFSEVDGEVVVLDLASSLYFSVNESGTSLWHALRHGATEDELTRLLVDAHGVERAVAAADVAAFVEQLRTEGLLDDASS